MADLSKRDVYGRVPQASMERAINELRYDSDTDVERAQEVHGALVEALHNLNNGFPAHHKSRHLVEDVLLALFDDVGTTTHS